MIWIFDIEIYKNYFGVIFKNPKTKELKEFIIFEKRNDFKELIDFIHTPDLWLIGYNNYNFDNQLLNFMNEKSGEYIIMDSDSNYICNDIYLIAKLIINDNFSEHMYKLPFKYIDLMKVGNLQHKALKLLAVNLKWYKIQELPIPWDKEILDSNLELLHSYNLNDVEITEVLYNILLDKIKLRFKISEKYNVDVYSESDSGIGNRLLEKFYSDITNLKPNEFKLLRTKRPLIRFRDIVFNFINFKTKELQELHESIINHTYYENMPFFNKSVIFDGVKYKLGVGGLHSVDKAKIFEETNDNYLIDADVESMYPSIIANYQLVPKHLSNNFVSKYREILQDRIKAKHEGRIDESEALKIVLHGTFGKTIYKNHWLYDPLVGYKITVNGQLLLLMLIEELTLNGFKVISANTDGVLCIVNKNKLDLYLKVCKDWENITSLNLEYSYYKKYIRKDVNNYIAIKDNDKIKQKGEFSTELNLRKGFDKPIISIALYDYFIHNIPIKNTILNHKDIYDFCTSKKIDSKFTNEYHYIENREPKIDKLQKIVRFYVSLNGGILYKKDEEGKIINYCVGKYVTLFNNYIHFDNFNKYNINYNYYISETQKIIDQIINPQLTLF
jgi:hypothetical protein